MDNNSKAATPVNLIAYLGSDPIPVIITDSGFPVSHQATSEGTLVTQAVISAVPCELADVAGFNGDPAVAIAHFVQLHDAAAAIAPGDTPLAVFPVYGMATYSMGVNLRFAAGIVIALSTTADVFTAPASDLLGYFCVYRTAT